MAMKSRRSRGAVIGLAAIVVIAALVYALRVPVTQFALAKGIGAVADLVLELWLELSERLLVAYRGEQGIVAEAA